MSLRVLLERELTATLALPATLEVRAGVRRLECDLSSANSLACEFKHFTLSTDELSTATVPELRAMSEALSARLTYLLEPVSPVEQDAEQCIVQMRSVPPQKDDDGRSYYELLVRRGGSLTLCRYHKEPRQPRTVIPACVTREVLLRLAADFEAVLG